MRQKVKLNTISRNLSYNALICDERNKLRNLKQSNIKISSQCYADYEFFKLQVPLTHEKISLSYMKLMDLCAFSKFFSQLLKRTAKSDLLATVLTI
jgi:hypothetical protein